MSRRVAVSRAVLIIVGVVVAAATPATASGAFGDDFGMAPINDGVGPGQEPPALPGASHAFWAGTCDTTGAPALGQQILPASGPARGIGNYATKVWAPDGTTPQTEVNAPPKPPHCIEWGGPGAALAGPALGQVWRKPPAWRLPAQVQAGGHPDGTVTMAFARNGASASVPAILTKINGIRAHSAPAVATTP